MKKIVFAAVVFFLFPLSASAIYCPVGGAIYHRSGEESAAIARCTEYIKQARASGQKIPNERAWRASKPWESVQNGQPYPLSWASSGKDVPRAEVPTRQTKLTGDVSTPRLEEREKSKDKPQTKEVRLASPPPKKKPDAVASRPVEVIPPAAQTAKPEPPLTSQNDVSIGSVVAQVVPPAPVAETLKQGQLQETEKQIVTTAPPVVALLERRVALVIGNSKYTAHGALDNPKNDAEAIASTLRDIGFQSVMILHDLGRDKMVDALQTFAGQADDADWAMVYYAGHGIEVGGSNYLVPVDARLKADRDVQFEAVALDHVLNSVESARKLRLVVLDACRDNPFLVQMRRTVATRSIGRGLAPIETERSMLIFFAAKHGQISLDRVDGQNSPFTTSLIRWMKSPDIEINKVVRHVRDDVLRVTQRSQEPYQYGSLSSDDFYFSPTPSQAGKN